MPISGSLTRTSAASGTCSSRATTPTSGMTRYATDPGPIEWTIPVRESILVLEGTARIEIEGGPTLELGVGDLASLPEGAVTLWHVTVPYRSSGCSRAPTTPSRHRSIRPGIDEDDVDGTAARAPRHPARRGLRRRRRRRPACHRPTAGLDRLRRRHAVRRRDAVPPAKRPSRRETAAPSQVAATLVFTTETYPVPERRPSPRRGGRLRRGHLVHGPAERHARLAGPRDRRGPRGATPERRRAARRHHRARRRRPG